MLNTVNKYTEKMITLHLTTSMKGRERGPTQVTHLLQGKMTIIVLHISVHNPFSVMKGFHLT